MTLLPWVGLAGHKWTTYDHVVGVVIAFVSIGLLFNFLLSPKPSSGRRTGQRRRQKP
jgi:multisubunit Na+/H+ antiporter MnhE subunit